MEEPRELDPILEAANLRFLLGQQPNERLATKLLYLIADNHMTPVYLSTCETLGWPVDPELLDFLRKNNMACLEQLEDDVSKATGNEELCEALYKKGQYLCRIGDKRAVAVLNDVIDKTMLCGQKVDAALSVFRIGLSNMDYKLMETYLQKVKSFQTENWSQHSQLLPYEAVHAICRRDFKTAATLLIESAATFSSYELMDYNMLTRYLFLTAMFSLTRVELKKCIIDDGSVHQALLQDAQFREFFYSLYNCRYKDFFQSLMHVEELIQHDRLFYPFCRYYMKDMRLKAYSQMLHSYRSLSLQNMALAFGVSPVFIENDISHFIANHQLHYQIDGVSKEVINRKSDNQSTFYQCAIKQGDNLLNRLNKIYNDVNLLVQ